MIESQLLGALPRRVLITPSILLPPLPSIAFSSPTC